MESGATCVAYETVELPTRELPLLTPMSEVAGRMAVQEGAKYLEKLYGGRGVLLGGVPGVAPAKVVILGGGIVGINAAKMAAGMGASLTVDPTERTLEDVQHELGMTEGFDVGLEMSGNAEALHQLIANMSHGGRIALLGIPTEEIAIDWTQVVFNMLTLRGIYGREMYETWYQMTVMLQSGLDISPVITHRLPYSEFAEGFAVAGSGRSGKVVLDWTEA